MIVFIIAIILLGVTLPFVGWWALLVFGIALFIGWCIWLSVPDCPRQIMGYNCKGDKCDHSKETLTAAKIATVDFFESAKASLLFVSFF